MAIATTDDEILLARYAWTDRTTTGGVGILLVVGAIMLTVGPTGAVAGGLLVGLWYVLPLPYTLAAAHLSLLVLFPERMGFVELALIEGGFVALLLLSAVESGAPLRDVTATAVAVLLFFGTIRAGQEWFNGLWVVALAFLSIAALLTYGLHRYELVRLGLVEDPS